MSSPSAPIKGANHASNFTAVATDRLWMDRVAKEENYQRMFAYDLLGHTATAQALVSSGSIITKSASQLPYSVYNNKHNSEENSPLAAKRREKLGMSSNSLPALSPKRLGEASYEDTQGGITPVKSDIESPLNTTGYSNTNRSPLSRTGGGLPTLGDVAVHPWSGTLSGSTSPRRAYTEHGLLDEQMAKRLAVSTGKKGYGSSFLMKSVAQDSYNVRNNVELKGDVSGFRRRKFKYE